MPLINCEINLMITWSINCVNFSGTGKTEFAITNTKFYFFAVALSSEGNM